MSRRLSTEEEQSLILRYRAGDKVALDSLLRSHWTLLRMEAAKFRSAVLSRGDLFQEAFLGWMAGLCKFDPTRDVRLWTFVQFHVRQSLYLAVVLHRWLVGGGCRRDTHMFWQLRAIHCECQATGANFIDSAHRELGGDRFRVELLCDSLRWDASLDAPVHSHGESGSPPETRLDRLPAPEPEREPGCMARVCAEIDRLPARERELVTRRYLFGERQETIAAEWGRSRECLRLIEMSAIRTLRERLCEEVCCG